MNLKTMEEALKRYGFDNKDPLKVWLNAAMHELEAEKDWSWLEGTPVEQEMLAGENILALPANTLKIITVKDETNVYKLNYYDWRKFERDIREPKEVGKPEVYTINGLNTIQIWRVLEAPTKLMVKVQLQTLDMALAADEPKTGTTVWPLAAHYPIVMRAASIALQAESEEDRAKTAQSEYERALMALSLKFDQRELDEPLGVEDTQGYGSSDPYSFIID